MAQTETQMVAAELEVVQKKVPLMFERDAMFYANLEKRPVEKVSSRDMRVPLEIRPGGLFGYYDPAGGDLGRGEGPLFEKATVSTTNIKYAIEWHKKAQWSTDDARKSVVNNVRHLMAVAMKEFRRQVDSLLMGSGDGVLGTITSLTGTGPYVLTLNSDGFATRLIRHGQKVNIYDTTLATQRTLGDERSVTLVDGEAKTVTIAGGAIAGITAGDKVVSSGLSGANPVGMLGVPYHHSNASTGTWLGLSRVNFPEIRASRVNASGSLGLSHPRLALNKIGSRLGLEERPKVTAWMHPCQVQAYEELGQLVTVINKTANAKEGMDLYFNVGQIAGVPIRQHFNWDKKRIDFIVDEVWGRAEMKAVGFYEEEGRRLFEVRGASGGVAAATIFYLVGSFQPFVNNPAGCSYIDGLDIPSGY